MNWYKVAKTKTKTKNTPCWNGYEMIGMKEKNGKEVPNCVPIKKASSPSWTRKEGKNPKGGLNQKGRDSYNRENPGSNLKAPVTTPPSKLKPGSKAAKRRKSFCARSAGQMANFPDAAKDPNSRLRLSRKKWNC